MQEARGNGGGDDDGGRRRLVVRLRWECARAFQRTDPPSHVSAPSTVEERRALREEKEEVGRGGEEMMRMEPFAGQLVCAVGRQAMMRLPLLLAEEEGEEAVLPLLEFARVRAERAARAYAALWSRAEHITPMRLTRALVGRAAEQADALIERVEARVEALARLPPRRTACGEQRQQQCDVPALEAHRQSAEEWTPRLERAYAELLLTRLPDVVLPRFMSVAEGMEATPARAEALRATAEALWSLWLQLLLPLP